ncbi:MAG: response regulator [Rikenellaceae bacterium]|nr:response regulator [Rikenellaceae bacterium]
MMQQDSRTENGKLKRLMDAARLGWWEADFNRQMYYISDYMIDLFGFDRNEITFDEFLTVVREDHRSRIAAEFYAVRSKEEYDQTFPVYSEQGVVWIHAWLVDRRVDPDGNVVTLGSAQCVSDPGARADGERTVRRLNNLMYQQKSISESLLAFLSLEDSSEVIDKMLRDVLTQFGGGRVCLFEYDHEARMQTCTYEVSDHGVPPMKAFFQRVPCAATPWWSEQIMAGQSIVLTDLDRLPAGALDERGVLGQRRTQSVMGVPLMSRDNAAWGFVALETVGKRREWSSEDYQWFSSMVNVISVCMQLHKSENGMRRDKQNLENLYRHMPAGYLRMKVLTDESGAPEDLLFVDANDATAELTGYPLETYIGYRASEIASPLLRHIGEITQVLNLDAHSEYDFKLTNPDRYFHAIVYSPLRDEVVALLTDTTDAVTAHRALEEREALLRNIYKNLPVGIELYDERGAMVDINDKDLEIFGLDRKEQALGVSIFENPNIPDHLKERLRRREEVDFAFNYNFDRLRGYYPTRKSGTIYLVTKVVCLYDTEGRFRNYMFINIDNTETSNAYTKIEEFEDLFQLVGKYARVGYAHFNAVTREGYAHNTWYDNLGEVQGTPLDRVVGVVSHMHPDDRAVMKAFMADAKAGKAVHLCLDARINRGGDEWTWTRINVVVKDCRPEEGVTEMICVNYDITPLKQTQEQLVEARDKAEASDRLKSAFLANMSHEIRTPLNAIVGFSELLAECDDRAERLGHLDIVRKNNELLLQLISDILDLSKIEAGTFEFVDAPIDVRMLCAEIVRSMSIRVPQGVCLAFDESLPPYVICGDRSRVTQVISNFLTNALKFTAQGSVTLGYERAGDMLRFFVRDTGIGIPAAKCGKVFDRFVKLDAFAQGSGLGLSICRSLVGQMGGTIGVSSAEGEGSCFWFTHPCDFTAEAPCGGLAVAGPALLSAPAESAAGVKPLILVAEDIDSNYKLVEAILKRKYRLLRARNGTEAVALAASSAPDLILMDIKMPGMDGIEATRHIRERDRQTVVIAVTAFAFDRDKQRALEAGCDDYISKPISADVLNGTIERWLQSGRR